MKKILITGASGYLGNALLNYYSNLDYEITILVRKTSKLRTNISNCKVIYGDILDVNSVILACKEQDVVIHTAGIVTVSNIKLELAKSVNVMGTKNVCEACLSEKVKKLIYVSSSSVFEPCKVVDEKTPYRTKFNSIYDQTKIEASNLVKEYISKGLNANIVYPTAIIGKYDFGTNISNTAINMPLNTSKNGITFTFGANDFVDVEDVLRAIDIVINKGKFGEDYVVSGNFLKLKEIAQAVNEVRQGKMKVYEIPKFVVNIACFFTEMYSKVFKKNVILTKASIKTVMENAHYSSEKLKNLCYEATPIKNTVENTIKWQEEVKNSK